MPVKELSNTDIVMLAIGKLNITDKPIHQEKIYAKAYELAPERFSWRLHEYKGWPNTEIIRRALRTLCDRGHLRVNEINLYLTPDGIKWLKDNMEKDNRVGLSNKPIGDYSYYHKAVKSVLYLRYLKKEDVSKTDCYLFTDMLGLLPQTDLGLVASKTIMLRTIAEEIKDDKFISFLDKCENMFLNKELVERKR